MEQPSLFPDQSAQPQEVVDTDAVAEKIGKNAKPVDYQYRPSEATLDQGWGPVDTPRRETTNIPPHSRRRTPRFGGKEFGDTETDGGIQPAGRETFVPLTDEEKRAGKLGLEAARKALQSVKENSEED